MRKLLLWSFVFIAVVFAAIFIVFPAKVHFRKTMYVEASYNSASRFVLDQKAWQHWWPDAGRNIRDTVFSYKNFEFATNWKMISGDSVLITSKNGTIHSLLNLIPVNKDSVGFQWEGESTAQSNIYQRIQNYFIQKELQNNSAEIFTALKTYLENDDKVYDIIIEHKMVVDTLLISTKKIFKTYPSTEQVYEMINELNKYVEVNKAFATNPPMLHVVQDSGVFKTMVAIPLDKEIKNTNNFITKKMIAGKILIAQINGGSASAETAIKKLELYMDDYHMLSPAISYQSLVTDRMKEKDSTKWITKVYYPVM